MKILPFDEIGAQAWDAFCLHSDDAWFHHTSSWIDYSMNMRFERQGTMNLSFGVLDAEGLVAIVPLIREKINNDNMRYEFGFAGVNNPFPAFSNELTGKGRERLLEYVFLEIDRVAVAYRIDYAAFEISPLTARSLRECRQVNPLPDFGFNDTQIASCLIDLNHAEDELLRRCRKGHKSDIKVTMKTGASVFIVNSSNLKKRDFELYRTIHLKAAGRQTRPDRTWEIMYEWIKNDLAILSLFFSSDNDCKGAVLSLVYKGGAYYGSSCVLPEYSRTRGVMHLLLWETVIALKKKGIRWYETGWQYTPTLSQEVSSKKELNIALFKRGFGGRNVPYWRGEKFYDFEYMEVIIGERIKKLKEFKEQ